MKGRVKMTIILQYITLFHASNFDKSKFVKYNGGLK